MRRPDAGGLTAAATQLSVRCLPGSRPGPRCRVSTGRNRQGDGARSEACDQASEAFEGHLTPAMPMLAASPCGYQACPRRGADYCARFARSERQIQRAAGRSCTAVRAGPLIWVLRFLGSALRGWPGYPGCPAGSAGRWPAALRPESGCRISLTLRKYYHSASLVIDR